MADASASHVSLARASHSPRLPSKGWESQPQIRGEGAGDNGEQGQGLYAYPLMGREPLELGAWSSWKQMPFSSAQQVLCASPAPEMGPRDGKDTVQENGSDMCKIPTNPAWWVQTLGPCPPAQSVDDGAHTLQLSSRALHEAALPPHLISVPSSPQQGLLGPGLGSTVTFPALPSTT